MTGLVAEVIPGFFQGEPGSLVILDSERVIKSREALSEIFLFVPQARFAIGNLFFCKRMRLLKPGDRIIAFSEVPPVGPVVEVGDLDTLLWQSSGAGLQATGRYDWLIRDDSTEPARNIEEAAQILEED